MKCPKCGYISFDFNDACPSCRRDLTTERARLNLPPFRPDPPLLIGALIGQSNESGEGLGLEGPRSRVGLQAPLQGTQPFGAEDSQAIEELELGFRDSQAVDFELKALAENAEKPAFTRDTQAMHGESLTLDLEDLSLDDEPPELKMRSAAEEPSEEPLFPSDLVGERGSGPGPALDEEDLDMEIEDLVIEDLPLEPVLSESEPDQDFFEKTVVMQESVPPVVEVIAPSSQTEQPEPSPPRTEPETHSPPRLDVFFDLDDIKEDEIGAIKISPPGDPRRVRERPPEEEAVTPPESPARPPVKPAVSEELKLDWEEFNLDFDSDEKDQGKN